LWGSCKTECFLYVGIAGKEAEAEGENVTGHVTETGHVTAVIDHVTVTVTVTVIVIVVKSHVRRRDLGDARKRSRANATSHVRGGRTTWPPKLQRS
jgi:hypothetical protein